QLLIHCLLLQSISNSGASSYAREFVLGAFQQYLRNQNMFCIWNLQRDTPEPMFSNNYYHPKATVVENSVFARFGRGNWRSCTESLAETLCWKTAPWETVAVGDLERDHPELVKGVSS